MHARREFLRRLTAGAALSGIVPSFLTHSRSTLQAKAADSNLQIPTDRNDSILVLLHMAGGNDGLNTLVPFAHDSYREARPKLALPAESVLKLNDSLGLHPALTGLKALYDSGQLAIVQGVGYPNPSRSHSLSTHVWQTGSDAEQGMRYGWIGRFFDHACPETDPAIGIHLGRQMPQAFTARLPRGICLNNVRSYRFIKSDRPTRREQDLSEATFQKLNQPDHAQESSAENGTEAADGFFKPNLALQHVERVALDAQGSSARIRAAGTNISNNAQYPTGKLANSLRLVAGLIGGGLPTRVYYVSQGGYDTHANQALAHQRLLKELGGSVEAFFKDLKAQGNIQRVLLMTFSEFGRRMAENGSAGTDHGAASVLFLAGQRVKAGLLGTYPGLAPEDLHRGDLKFTVDFRSVYAGILEGWLKTSSQPILGRRFTPLQLTTDS